MKIEDSRTQSFVVDAKVRWVSFLAVSLFMVSFFLAVPHTKVMAAEERVNWDSRCIVEHCQL